MDFDAAFGFVKIEIEKDRQGRVSVQPGFLQEFVTQRSGLKDVLSEEMQNRIIRHLETIFGTKQEDGHSLAVEFESWYPERCLSENYNPYFWRRLKKYWLDYSVIPKDSIRSTHEVTSEILGYLGDPMNEDSWRRRGLVMGHVQSGKTTNYSALITKAADAGYRIIIVLAGLTNSLREQTQERLDEYFVGKSSLGDELNIAIYPVAMVFAGMEGEPKDPRHPYCGTTQIKDFNSESARGVGANEGNFADPILFVTKKHESVLRRLTEWLSGLRQGRALDGPMLLIDDEADNASVNTAEDGDAVTRINQRIRELLKCSRRSSYVGYTATPFANIFIDPDSNDQMLNDNLFPKHFIKSLEPPDNYIGARNLFSPDGSLAGTCVVDVPDDYQDLLPLKHKSAHELAELPKSLVDAVLEYFLFRAIRVLDGETDRHSSMLVNVSRFNYVQKQVSEYIDILKDSVKEAADAWALSKSWKSCEQMIQLKEVWDEQYDGQTDYTWDEIRPALSRAISPVEVRMVNMKGVKLDYSKRKNNPLHVIAVGGLALARGLTLEGLAISYVLRNVGASDTLLQMGRWFGYRPGYAHLCRIHMTSDMREHFCNISEAVEELRADLVRMEGMGRSPDEFGLKVRESPTGIAITAANKMRTAEPIRLAADYSVKHIQAFELFNNEDINQRHMQAVRDLYMELENISSDRFSSEGRAFVWSHVPVDLVQKLLNSFELPRMDFVRMGDSSLISNYIAERSGAGESCRSGILQFRFPALAEAENRGLKDYDFRLALKDGKTYSVANACLEYGRLAKRNPSRRQKKTWSLILAAMILFMGKMLRSLGKQRLDSSNLRMTR